jgi:hypothetical protein
MSWEVKVDDKKQMVILKYQGTVTALELKESVYETGKVVIETGINNIFTDCTEMTWGHGVFDLISIISEYDAIGVTHSIKEAVLLPKNEIARSNVEFYETACFNRGYNVKMFGDIEQAFDWLLK